MPFSSASRVRINWLLTGGCVALFLSQMIFMQLSELDYLVQTCCGDGVRTELLSEQWWRTAIDRIPRLAGESILLAILAFPVIAVLIVSRSVLAKAALSMLFLVTALELGTVFIRQSGHAADRLGCVVCADFLV